MYYKRILLMQRLHLKTALRNITGPTNNYILTTPQHIIYLHVFNMHDFMHTIAIGSLHYLGLGIVALRMGRNYFANRVQIARLGNRESAGPVSVRSPTGFELGITAFFFVQFCFDGLYRI